MFHLLAKGPRERAREHLTLWFGVFIILQVAWFVWPRNSSGHPTPRVGQAINTHWSSSPTEQQAAIAEAIRLDDIERHRWSVARKTLILCIDGGTIYFYWKYGRRYTIA